MYKIYRFFQPKKIFMENTISNLIILKYIGYKILEENSQFSYHESSKDSYSKTSYFLIGIYFYIVSSDQKLIIFCLQ